MKKNELVKTILKNIQDINTIANKFEASKEIHQIDIDLALSKVRNLYDLLLNINSGAIYIPQDQGKELLTKPEQLEPEIKKPKQEKIDIPKTEVTEIEEKPIPEPEFIIEKPSAQAAIIVEKPQDKTLESSQNSNSPEIIADKFQSKKFIHDNISKKNVKKDVSAKMQTKPINDINSAIGLNDKFIFIRELFNNDKEHYHETIQVLNNFDIYENAVNFLNENFDWDSDDPNFERLKELVRRKYS